jgi:hypothetical protein
VKHRNARSGPRSLPRPDGRFLFGAFLCVCSVLAASGRASARERPYLATYSEAREEPGNLEISMKKQSGLTEVRQDAFGSGTAEFEDGVMGWSTSEFYRSGQTTSNHSTVFNGFDVRGARNGERR